MSKNKSVNKVLKRTAKSLDKSRNPLDKIARLGVNTSDIAHRVLKGGISQAKEGVDSVVDITTKRLRSARDEKKVKDIFKTQLDYTSSDVRSLVDVARGAIDIVADGVVDVLEEVSSTYDAYRFDEDNKTFKFDEDAAQPASAAKSAPRAKKAAAAA